jgi:hypothetical protein
MYRVPKKDANVILYELITTLSTYQEHNERQGHDVKRDEKFAEIIIQRAKELADLKAK